jgi:hypothetical protein
MIGFACNVSECCQIKVLAKNTNPSHSCWMVIHFREWCCDVCLLDRVCSKAINSCNVGRSFETIAKLVNITSITTGLYGRSVSYSIISIAVSVDGHFFFQLWDVNDLWMGPGQGPSPGTSHLSSLHLSVKLFLWQRSRRRHGIVDHFESFNHQWGYHDGYHARNS